MNLPKVVMYIDIVEIWFGNANGKFLAELFTRHTTEAGSYCFTFVFLFQPKELPLLFRNDQLAFTALCTNSADSKLAICRLLKFYQA